MHSRRMQIWTRLEYYRVLRKGPLLDGNKAARDLRFWFGNDYFEIQCLRSICQELGVMVFNHTRRGHWLSKDELQKITAAALESGRLVALYEVEKTFFYLKEKVEPIIPKQTSLNEWIELQVVWDDSGEPVCGLPVVVQPSRSSNVIRQTDNDGRIRLDTVPVGAAEVRCSFDDTSRDECVSFIGMGSVLRPDEEKQQAPTRKDVRPKAIVAAAKHKVSTGETLELLARGVNLTWQKLAKFNFNTEEPKKINQHFKNDIGCRRKTSDSQNYIFDDSDKPGIMILPKKWTQKIATSQCHVIRVMPITRPTIPFLFSV
ncbi:MAG: hypothetical protein JW841_09865 [Deltaproteobacteria bacterium]|nr:hypothetical protein [Deltaproteobacteria bacterium]